MSGMSPEEREEPADETRDEDPEAAAMQRRVDELGEQLDEAVKKAEVTHAQARPGADSTLKEDVGEWSGTRSDTDDASGAVDEGGASER